MSCILIFIGRFRKRRRVGGIVGGRQSLTCSKWEYEEKKNGISGQRTEQAA